MVRLLPAQSPKPLKTINAFQSHNGAIAASRSIGDSRKSSTVSIPQWCDCCLTPSRSSLPFADFTFNPTMVRLLPADKFARIQQILLDFQSHNGAIAAGRVVLSRSVRAQLSIPQWCDCCPSRWRSSAVVEGAFNPTMVRLLQIVAPDFLCFFNLSIPQWCDCCSRFFRTIVAEITFQSHNGAIAAFSALAG